MSSRKRLDAAKDQESGKMSYRDYVELSSIDEYKKFKGLPPIEGGELAEVDLDDLIMRLSKDL